MNESFQPQMHRALEILEIVEMIACHLRDKSALSFGLTCKGLIHTILDVIWGFRLETDQILQPLVATGAIESRFEEVRGGFSRSPNALDWDRFLPYARRIKSLYWMEDSTTRTVLKTLLKTTPQKPLFPRLQHITMDPNTFKDGSSLLSSQLVPSSLQSFVVENWLIIPISPNVMSRSTLFLTNCLKRLAMNCTQLRKLKVIVETGMEECSLTALNAWSSILQKPFVELFRSLHSLEEIELTLDIMHFELLTHLARLPRLRKLNLWLGPDKRLITPPLPLVDPESPFPYLEDLSVDIYEEAMRPVVLEQVTQLSKHSPLRRIDLSWDCGGSSSIKTALDAYSIHTKSQESFITVLGLHSRYDPLPPNVQYDLPCWRLAIHHLDSLSSPTFQNLTGLTITSSFRIALNDGDLETLAHWLPKLEILAFWPSWPHKMEPLVTIRGILSLARRCSGLRELRLPAVLTPYEELPVLGQTTSVLSSWNVSPCTLHQPKEVAMTLARLFPSLVELRGSTIQGGVSAIGQIRSFLHRTVKLRKLVTNPGLLDTQTLQRLWDRDGEDL